MAVIYAACSRLPYCVLHSYSYCSTVLRQTAATCRVQWVPHVEGSKLNYCSTALIPATELIDLIIWKFKAQSLPCKDRRLGVCFNNSVKPKPLKLHDGLPQKLPKFWKYKNGHYIHWFPCRAGCVYELTYQECGGLLLTPKQKLSYLGYQLVWGSL